MLITSPISDKKSLRAGALARRSRLAAALDAEATASFEADLMSVLSGCERVAGYWPMRDEIDVRRVLTALSENGTDVLLPVVVGKHDPLLFRSWRPGDNLITSSFGVAEPGADKPAGVPDCLIVPLLAFDRDGYRLGYGGGFYDRTLAELRAKGTCRAVGVAYAGQETDRLPSEDHDEPLDMIVTERGVLRCGGADGGRS